jgi:branched-chain amino acid transport system ATP-binding protein
MPAASLEVRGLSAGYGPTVVLEDVSFSVPAGSRLSILGRNGMGKTTLLSSLMGLTRRYGGEIRVDGNDVAGDKSSERALKGVGLVPQTRDIFRSLTVEENLLVGIKDRPRSVIQEAYDMFPRLHERRRNLGWQLSGGEQQMLSSMSPLRAWLLSSVMNSWLRSRALRQAAR